MKTFKLHQDYKRALRSFFQALIVLIGVLVISLFFPSINALRGLVDYPPFHTLLETCSIVVSMMVFGVCWSIHDEDRPDNFLILGCAFFGVGMIDFLHTISIEGMPHFVIPSGVEKGIYFWMAARFLLALGLLVVAIIPWRPLHLAMTRWIFLGAVLMIVAIIAWVGLFHLHWIPDTFIEGKGLTAFKKKSEYFIIALYAASAFFFLAQMNRPRPYDVVGLFAASSAMAVSEIFFTIYADPADIFLILGHIYKVIAYAFVYKSIFLYSVKAPYKRLNETNRRLEQEIYDRKIIEERLADNERLLSSILHTLPVAVFGKDIKKDFQIKIWNKSAEDLFGLKAEEFVGKYDYDLFPKEEADWFRAKDLEACNGEGIIDISEEIAQTKKGPIILHTRKTIVRDSKGEPIILLGVSEDITKRKQATDDLRDALNARDEFLAIASHELKTPITSLRLRLQILQRSLSKDEKLANEIKIAILQVDRLTKLIRSILDVARIQSGKFSIEISRVNLGKTTGEVLEQLAGQLATSHCQVEVQVAPEIEGLWDQARIEQVLVNLLSNVTKYAPNTLIKIFASQNESRTTLTVQDFGPGIPLAKQALLFKRFERAGAPFGIGGLGLGLYICKQIIEALGGSIRVESQEGKGSAFIVELPNFSAEVMGDKMPVPSKEDESIKQVLH
ncbi:MAG: sensor histidine kinase [Bacteriovorax sp.]